MENKPPKIKSALLIETHGARQIADALGITHQAVYSWEEFVPPLRAYQLLAVRPGWFKEKSTRNR